MRAFLLPLTFSLAFAQDVTVSSPNGDIRFVLNTSGERLTYSVSLRNKPAIEASGCGITVDGARLGEGVTVAAVDK